MRALDVAELAHAESVRRGKTDIDQSADNR